MKSTKTIFVFLLCILPLKSFAYQFYGEFRAGYFSFDESKLRHIFGNGAGYQAELGMIFFDYFGIALNGEYFHRHGHSFIRSTKKKSYKIDPIHYYETHKTSITLPSIAIVPKVFIPFCSYVQPYVGIGPRFFYLEINNHSSYVTRHVHKFQMGGSATVGMHVGYGGFFIDPFFDYSFVRMSCSKGKSSTCQDRKFNHYLIGIGIGGKI